MKIVKNNNVVYSLDKNNEPVLFVHSGDQVLFETKDCFSDSISKETDLVTDIDFSQVNPATGPIYVEEAKPGDVLKVYIEKITLHHRGVVAVAENFGLLGDMVESPKTRIFDVLDNKVVFLGEELPLRKMVGVIGTAPKKEAIITGSPAEHGGNMDTSSITEGSILYLPVFVEGALLAMGDLHALMGDGEVGVSGGEISGSIEVSVEVLKNSTLPTPLVENKDKIITIASHQDMKKASYEASKKMLQYVTNNTRLDIHDALMLISLTADLAVSQVVNPYVTMRMELDKSIIHKYK